jgi:Flp pilus assembly protein TadD
VPSGLRNCSDTCKREFNMADAGALLRCVRPYVFHHTGISPRIENCEQSHQRKATVEHFLVSTESGSPFTLRHLQSCLDHVAGSAVANITDARVYTFHQGGDRSISRSVHWRHPRWIVWRQVRIPHWAEKLTCTTDHGRYSAKRFRRGHRNLQRELRRRETRQATEVQRSDGVTRDSAARKVRSLLRAALATTWLDQGEPEKALDAIRGIQMDLHKLDPMPATISSRALLALGQLDEAGTECERGCELAPDDVSTMAQAALVAIASGDLDEADRLIEQGNNLLPAEPLLIVARAERAVLGNDLASLQAERDALAAALNGDKLLCLYSYLAKYDELLSQDSSDDVWIPDSPE